MGFRNPIRSLPADDITGGAFTGTYTLPGRLIVGDPAHARIEIDGSVPSQKMYAPDGVTVLVDLEPTGAVLTGRVQTSNAGARASVDPAVVTQFGTGPGVLLSTGDPAEQLPGGLVAFDGAGGPYLGLAGPNYVSGQPAGALQLFGWPAAPASLVYGARLTVAGSGGLFDLMPDGGDVIFGRSMSAGTIGKIGTLLGWSAPVLANGWSNFGGTWQPARYSRLVTGVVVLQGLITGGTTTVGTRLLTLPTGYRPAADHVFGVIAGGGVLCRVDVHADGTVTLGSAPSNTYLSLDGIRFMAGA